MASKLEGGWEASGSGATSDQISGTLTASTPSDLIVRSVRYCCCGDVYSRRSFSWRIDCSRDPVGVTWGGPLEVVCPGGGTLEPVLTALCLVPPQPANSAQVAPTPHRVRAQRSERLTATGPACAWSPSSRRAGR